MQRATALLFLAVVLASFVLVAVKVGPPSASGLSTASTAGTARGVAPGASSHGPTVPRGEEPRPEPPTVDPSGPLAAPEGSLGDAGRFLLSGAVPPSLGADAPKVVSWGVVLLGYQGAQGAPVNARSREAALALARDLAKEAKAKGFAAIVSRGDPGSMEKAGRMPQGMLEPAPEYELFRLGKGEVGGPVDTPRGFWIVQRIE